MQHYEDVLVTLEDLDGASGSIEDIARRRGGVPEHAVVLGVAETFDGAHSTVHFGWDNLPEGYWVEQPFEGADPVFIPGVAS